MWRQSGCLLALAMVLTACGGGGGGGASSPDPSYRLTFSPATLTASYDKGWPPTPTVTAALDRATGQTVNVAISDDGDAIDRVQAMAGSGLSLSFSITPKGSLGAGEHVGSLRIKLCYDDPSVCKSQIPGSPYTLPYRFTVTIPPAAVPSPERLSVDDYPGEAQPIKLSAQLVSGQLYYPQIIDKAGVFQANPPLTMSSNTLTATLTLSSTLAPGSYTGNVEIHVCKNPACTEEADNSPVLVPYAVTLKPSTNLTPLARAAGVGEWAQHQANAAHTGYVPVTLDPARFNRRWRWPVPAPLQAIHPVVTSNGIVYALANSFSSDEYTLHALSEHDMSLRWKKEFGSFSRVNPPSSEAGQVYLATSGYTDASMWRFDGNTGAVGFRTPFRSQGQRYLAPAIANGAVYTNGGYVGGLLSFGLGSGAQNWFADLYTQDMWTPAIDARHAYKRGDNGLQAFDVSTGQLAFNIVDSGSQSPDTLGAPMIVGINNVVTVSGSARLTNFDLANRSVKWAVTGSFTMAPAAARGVIYIANGAKLEARSDTDGGLLWSWAPDEASTTPFDDAANYGHVGRNILVTDNLVFVSTTTQVYAISLVSHQAVWSFPRAGRLSLSPSGLLYINVTPPHPGPGLYAINLN